MVIHFFFYNYDSFKFVKIFLILFCFGLIGACREHQITRLVTSRVTRAEKARRHGRELSYILPHNAVHQFASLFLAIEEEINTKANRLGILPHYY